MTTQFSAEKIFALAAVTAILLIVVALVVGIVLDEVFVDDVDSQGLVVLYESEQSGWGNYTQVLYDPDTLVMYAVVREDDGLAMSVLYNSDGTMKLYNPEK